MPRRTNFQLARIFGIRIGVSASWFLVLAFLIYWLSHAEPSGLFLGKDGSISPDEFYELLEKSPTREPYHFPGLVFLNACSTNRPASGVLGFPQAWIDAGAAAVIATLCPVPDVFALAFAGHFYGLLLGGDRDVHVADALLATRRHFMKEYNNPLGLAYVLYARKGTHVVARPQTVRTR